MIIEECEASVFRLNDTLTNEMSDIPDLLAMDKKVNAYLRKWQMKGASLAITRGDSLVYAKGYGWADEENGQEMTPRHILRMASVSKLITAAGIMVLHDRGDLNIKDTVFGPAGILNDSTITALIKDRTFNFLIKPDFISYKYTALPLKKRKIKNKKVLAWTITSQEIFGRIKPYIDNIIFENFIPN